MYKYFHFFFIFLMFYLPSAFSLEYYVSTMGVNSNPGTCDSPFKAIAKALGLAKPGDTIYLEDGQYNEVNLDTVTAGELNHRITLKAINPRQATISSTGSSILDIFDPFYTIEGIVFDGQFQVDRPIRIRGDATGLVLRNVEVMNANHNCIDMSSDDCKDDILIENSEIHHCILGDESDSDVKDAHGITGSNVHNLIIRNTEIYYITGDAVQFDPGRNGNWDLTIDSSHFWTGPLPEAVPGFTAGFVIGENAFDSKQDENLPERSTVVIQNSLFHGWRNNPKLTREAALNIKERVFAIVDANTFYDNEIGMRLRGRPDDGGAHVTAINNVFYDNDIAIRYEQAIENLRIYNNTFGLENINFFDARNGVPAGPGFEVLNNEREGIIFMDIHKNSSLSAQNDTTSIAIAVSR